jgi:hypothetical protein
MSYHLIDFNKKITDDDFNFENLIIGKKIETGESAKYYMYYMDHDTPKEIYIRLPKLRLVYGLANRKYDMVNIPLYPNYTGVAQFIEFIKTLETNINELYIKKKINKEFSSLINKKNGMTFIKTNINDNVKITSNIVQQGCNITLNDFKLNGMIEMVLCLSYIWTNVDKIGLSSNLYQIKYNGLPEQLNVDMIDTNQPVKNVINKEPCSMIVVKKPTEVIPSQIGVRMVPSIKDLQFALKGLNKVVND